MAEVKPYRIIARLKNNRLWQAIVEKWPEVKNQDEAGRKLGISPLEIGRLLNMTVWPAKRKKFKETGEIEWWPIVEKIWLLLEKDPEYLFDPKYYEIRPVALSLEFKPEELEKTGLLSLPEPSSPELTPDKIRTILATLTPREEQILRLRFGIGECEHTAKECGEKFTVSRNRIFQIEAKALEKLRQFPYYRRHLLKE